MVTLKEGYGTLGIVGNPLDYDKSDIKGGSATFTTTVVNLVTATLGCGILSLPWASQGSSAVLVVAVTAAVLSFNVWAAGFLVDAAARTGVSDLGALMGKCLGRNAEWLCNAAIWLCMFPGLVAYLIVIAGGVARLVDASGFGNGEILLQVGGLPRAAFLVLISVALSPLCFLPPSRLAFTSSLAVIANLYLFSVIAVDGVKAPKSTCMVGVGPGVMSLASNLNTAVAIHMCFLPLYADMAKPSPVVFRSALNVSFLIVGLLMVAFSVLAGVAYGPATRSNILLNLHGLPGAVAQMGMVAVMMCVYPLMLMPMVAPLSRRGWGTAAVLAAGCATATFVDDLGVLNVYNGALFCFCFATMAPVLVGFSDPKQSRVKLVGVLILGTGVSVFGFVQPSNLAEDLRCFWRLR